LQRRQKVGDLRGTRKTDFIEQGLDIAGREKAIRSPDLAQSSKGENLLSSLQLLKPATY
jgi:hypothetical protein